MTKLVAGSIPNLINGVSQQAPALRLATQAEDQQNFYSTIVEGLKDRPPTEFVAKLLDTLPDGVFTHVLNRDATERYIMVCDGTDVRVFDFDGNEKTVSAPDGYGYLTGVTDADADLTALTVADYTFVVNRKMTTAMAAATSPSRPHEALINVAAGNYGKTYSIIINGVTAAAYGAPDGTAGAHAAQIDTSYIANQLLTALVGAGFNTAPWNVVLYGNAVWIQRYDGTDFEITVEDGMNGNAMKVAKDRVQKFTDLAERGPDGFVIEVVGDNTNSFGNYWVKLETTGSGTGVWKETVKPEIMLGFDGDTMPHTLVREADGTFTFAAAEWDPRVCGDETISPEPTFIGSVIRDVFFHRNRLGFLVDESAVMSRNGSFFNFFRETATTILDDDPIDVGASHVKVSILNSAVPFQDDLLLFSENTQFRLAGNEMLTPKTVSMKPITEFVNDPDVTPLTLGTSVFFAAKRGDYEALWEYIIDKSTGSPDVSEVTSHVPAYLPNGVFRIVGRTNENFVGVLSTGDQSAIYVYKYYWSANQKLQAAWQRWELSGDPTILNAEFVESDLYVVVKRSDGVYLERLRVKPNAVDEGLGFLVHLDQRVHTDQLVAPTYDAGTNTTTFTLPYEPPADIFAVTAPGGTGLAARSLEVVSVDAGTKTVKVRSDVTTEPMWFGTTYERRYRFSRFFIRQAATNGGTTTVQSGRLQLSHMTLTYDKSAYFRVEVTPVGRQTYTYEVTGRDLGDANNVLGTVPLISSKKAIPILSRNDRVTIDIVNDSWMPSSFISVEWFGRHSEKAKEL